MVADPPREIIANSLSLWLPLLSGFPLVFKRIQGAILKKE